MLSTQIKFLRRPRRTLLLAVLTQEGDKVLIIVNPFSISKTPAIRQSIYIYFSFQFQTLRQKKKVKQSYTCSAGRVFRNTHLMLTLDCDFRCVSDC